MDGARGLSRRLLLGAAAAAWFTGEAAAQQQKLTRAEAKYQDLPHGQQRCSICLQFLPPGQCQLVAGPINPNGWCQFFAARENAR